ncbi:aluminum-activated malate transporter 4-like [Dorcoceras hygrometricum]|uniref:Aluminum-activated malate transporter 4-like n=1 Tax=Dorcoceras hygrometricum TaxID=472368 RepID=A0A2Z7C2X9_9LAMI|nr:aluminum-activated malate transporter 4-like [Dorcoceras hygrometricum]
MSANFGSLRQSFADRGRERLLSRKYDSEVGLDDVPYTRREGCFYRIHGITRERLSTWWADAKGTAITAYEMGRSDPRKVVFAAKMGGALSLVSLLSFFQGAIELYRPILHLGYPHWGTLNKGFNRGLGTVSAGALSLGIAELSEMAGDFQEVVIVVSIFIAGFVASYVKQHPAMKQYEYGFRVFLLTFCIVLVSGASHFVETAVSRLLLIAVGAGVCLLINACIYPIWAGEDLHKLVVKNFKGIASSLEGCISMYLQSMEYTRIPSKILLYQASDDPLYKGYRAVVESTSEEESLLRCAVWEPPHGRYKMFNYPWNEYVKVSGALRHCAFMVMAMHGCILAEIQAPSELRQVFKNEIQRVGQEGAKVLRLLGEKVEKMEKLNPGDMLQEVHDSAEDLQLMIDQKSYLLVNADGWESSKRPGKFVDPEQPQEQKDNESKPPVINSLGDSTMNLKSNPSFRPFDPQNPNMSVNISVSPVGIGENVLRHQTTWPSRPLNDRETRTYESASALSLSTFTSLLIEFVARLQNIVDSFEDLSEKAKFKDPIESTGSKVDVSLWRRLQRCICFSD